MESVINNDDMLTEILLRLPVKSLTRFRLVSKKWLSLISSDHLCHQHTLRRPKPQPSLILEKYNHKFYFDPTINGEKILIPFSLNVPHHEILHSCNGLFLLSSNRFRNSYYVYNPTTRKSRKVSLVNNDKFHYVAGASLAFDPSQSPYYKIVCVRSYSDPDSDSDDPFTEQFAYQMEVYNSESHTWKLDLDPFTHSTRIFSNGVYCKKAIYWPSYKGYYYYDIAKNEMKAVCYPPNPHAETFKFLVQYMQESNGHLYHVEVVEDRDESESVLVWEAGGDDHHSEWFLKHHHPTAGCAEIVRLMAGSDPLSLLVYSAGKIRAYSFLDKSYEDFVDISFCPSNVFQFGEILALV